MHEQTTSVIQVKLRRLGRHLACKWGCQQACSPIRKFIAARYKLPTKLREPSSNLPGLAWNLKRSHVKTTSMLGSVLVLGRVNSLNP